MKQFFRVALIGFFLFLPTLGKAQVTDSLSTKATIPDSTKAFQEYLTSIIDSSMVDLDLENLPPSSLQKVDNLNVSNIPAREFLRALGRQYDINLIVENELRDQITLRFSDISVIEVLIFICQEYEFELRQSGQVLRISRYVPPEPIPEVKEQFIEFREGRISLDVNEADLMEFSRQLSVESGYNIMVRNGVRGTLTGFLQDVEFQVGMDILLNNNGFSLRQKDGVYIIDRFGFTNQDGGSQTSNFWVNIDDGLVSLDVVNANITDLIREIGYQADANMITYGLPNSTITAKANELTIEQTLNYIFRGTSFTYRKEGDMYIIGDKSTSGIATNKLIRLKHVRSDVVMEMIPDPIKRGALVQVIKEQNGLMVIGTNDIIVELESFIKEIDFPTPQIMIEALVVDVNTSDMYQLGTSLVKSGAPDSSFFNPFTVLFGDSDPYSNGLTVQGSGGDVNRAFSASGNLFGIKNLGTLPKDFFFRIQALDLEGLVTVQSRPQISTLNGHPASIEIGTTQYYILRTTTPLQSPNQIVTQESEQFQQIEANVMLEITPWVSTSGEVTVEIHPEFNTPVGTFSSEVPPTINRRVLDSTVRLKDGETIILGGLIQESETENLNKVPILGNIPLLGRLFRNKSTSTLKSELVVFVTPYVFYGNEEDDYRWNQLRDEMELSIDN